MNLPELSHEPLKRGPITCTFNGNGRRAWLPEVSAEPGWVSVIELRRLCAAKA